MEQDLDKYLYESYGVIIRDALVILGSILLILLLLSIFDTTSNIVESAKNEIVKLLAVVSSIIPGYKFAVKHGKTFTGICAHFTFVFMFLSFICLLILVLFDWKLQTTLNSLFVEWWKLAALFILEIPMGAYIGSIFGAKKYSSNQALHEEHVKDARPVS